jgi:hypothetical protein
LLLKNTDALVECGKQSPKAVNQLFLGTIEIKVVLLIVNKCLDLGHNSVAFLDRSSSCLFDAAGGAVAAEIEVEVGAGSVDTCVDMAVVLVMVICSAAGAEILIGAAIAGAS